MAVDSAITTIEELKPEDWPGVARLPENEGSIGLHERVGFEVVGRRKRLGKLHGVWRDVLLLERRSETVN
jgi:L-amino acid N-acyltransferase YncA